MPDQGQSKALGRDGINLAISIEYVAAQPHSLLRL